MTGRRTTGSGAFEIVRSSRHVVRCDGELLRRYRAAWGHTLVDAARTAGISVQALRNAERGLAVGIETANRLAEATGISLDTLLVAEPTQNDASLAEHGLRAPPAPTLLVGRDAEIAAIAAAVRASGGTVVLSGVSGVGKSAVARKVAAELRLDLPGGVLWVDCAQLNTDERVVAMQRRIAMALGFGSRMPEGGAVRAETFATSFQLLFWDQQRLLVLDDVPSARVYRLFNGEGGPSHRLLVTTRLRSVAEATGGREVRVGALSTAATLQLLAHYVGLDRLNADTAGCAKLMEVLGGVPRAIHVAGRVLARERYTQLSDFATQYGGLNGFLGGGREVDWSRAEISDVHHAGSVERFLSADALRIFAPLQVFGTRTFPLDWCEAVCGEPAHVVRRSMAELVDLFVFDDVTSQIGSRGPMTSPLFRRADADRIRLPISRAERDAIAFRLAQFLRDRATRIAAQPLRDRAALFLAEWECWVPWLEGIAAELLVENDLENWHDPGKLVPVWCAADSPRAALPIVVAEMMTALQGSGVVVPLEAVVASLKVDPATGTPTTHMRLAAIAAEHQMMRTRNFEGALRWARVATAAAKLAGGGAPYVTGRSWVARLLGLTGDLPAARVEFGELLAHATSSPSTMRSAARVCNDHGLMEARIADSDPQLAQSLFAKAIDYTETASGLSQFGSSMPTFSVGALYRANAAVWLWLRDPVGGLAELRRACLELFAAGRECAPLAARINALASVAGFSLDGRSPEFCGEQGHRMLIEYVLTYDLATRIAPLSDLDLLGWGATDWLAQRAGRPCPRVRIYVPPTGSGILDDEEIDPIWPGSMATLLPGLTMPHAVCVDLLRRDRAGTYVEFFDAMLGRENPRTVAFRAAYDGVREAFAAS